MILINILLIIILIGLIIFFLNLLKNNLKLKKVFEKYNVEVFGPKGNGKDLITQLVINLRKEPYMSNINYGGKYNNIDIKDLNLDPNDYEHFIDGNIEKIKKKEEYEGIDVYLSDIGIHLPSTYDFILNKKYPTFPIYYALSRQLYDQNIHFNTQAIKRPWVKIREQADFYIYCKGVIKLPGLILIKITYYDSYESAEKKLQPIKRRLLNKFQRAEAEIYQKTNGIIENSMVIIRKNKIYYDTREFHTKLFKYKAPDKRIKKLIRRKQNARTK